MMKMRLAGLLSAWVLVLAAPVAATVDVEGPDSSGANDTAATAEKLPALSATASNTVYGWIDANNENDVDFYEVTLEAPATVYFDIDFAEDAGVASDDDVGLDPELWVFDAAGSLIATNDDSDFFQTGPGFNAGTDPGSDPFADHDPFIGELLLAAGTYHVAVTHWANDANGSLQPGISFSALSDSGSGVIGATPDTGFELAAACVDPVVEQCIGAYQLQVRTDFAGVVDSEGASSSGLNDSALSAQSMGVLQMENGTLTTIGWIDENNVNDVDFWEFSVPETAGVHFDIDFAEDIRSGGDFDEGLDPELWVFDSSGRMIANNDDSDFFEIGGCDFDEGLDPELWVFDSSGRMIANNDDSDFFEIGGFNAGSDPGSDPFGDHDPCVGELTLDPGTYTVAVAYWANNAKAISQPGLSFTSLSQSGDSISGATPDATFALDRACDDPVFEQCVGAYQLQVRSFFVPEPGVVAGQLCAGITLALLAGARRRASAR
jgi:hypothetical protein